MKYRIKVVDSLFHTPRTSHYLATVYDSRGEANDHAQHIVESGFAANAAVEAYSGEDWDSRSLTPDENRALYGCIPESGEGQGPGLDPAWTDGDNMSVLEPPMDLEQRLKVWHQRELRCVTCGRQSHCVCNQVAEA